MMQHDQLAQLSKDWFEEFIAVHPPQRLHPPRIHVSKKAPPMDSYKINFYGAIFPRKNQSGIGGVVHNSEGLVITSLSQQLPQAFQSLEIEAIVTSRALEFGIEVEVHQAILEGDSAMIMKAMMPQFD